MNLRILDPRKLSKREAKRIRKTFGRLVENERKCDEKTLGDLRKELSEAVLAPLGMEERVEELGKIVDALLQARVKRGGMHAEVIIGVEETERQQIMRIKGAIPRDEKLRRVTLDDFIES